VLADAGSEPGIVTADLDLDRVAEVRASLPTLGQDRAYAPPVRIDPRRRAAE